MYNTLVLIFKYTNFCNYIKREEGKGRDGGRDEGKEGGMKVEMKGRRKGWR